MLVINSYQLRVEEEVELRSTHSLPNLRCPCRCYRVQQATDRPPKSPRKSRQTVSDRRCDLIWIRRLTTGEEMKIKLGLDSLDGSDNGVTSVVSTGATSADVGFSSQDVDELALACRWKETSEPTSECVWAGGRVRKGAVAFMRRWEKGVKLTLISPLGSEDYRDLVRLQWCSHLNGGE